MDNLDAFSTSGMSDEIGGILNTPLEDNSSLIGLKKALHSITSSSSRSDEIDNAQPFDSTEGDDYYSTSNNRSLSLRNRFIRNPIDNWILSNQSTNFTPVAFLPSIDKNTPTTKTLKLDPLTGTPNSSENTAKISTVSTTSSSIQPKSLLPNIIPIGLNLLSTSDSGTSGDNITNDNTPTIGVDIATGLLVRLFDNQQTIGQSILSNPFQVTTTPLADGVHTITGKALSLLGNLLPSTSTSLQLTIDTLLPQLNLTTDVEDTVLIEGSHLSGIVDGTGTAIASLSYHFDNQNKIPILFNSVTGEFDAELNLAGLESGVHILTLVAVDKAGNTLTTNLEVEININLSTSDIVLKENSDFKVTASQAIEIPDTPSILSFKLADIDFDTTDNDSIKDAFEVALVDESGNSLVHTIGKGRDSFFNLTESQPIALAPGAKFNDKFTLDLTELIPGLVIGGDKVSIDLSQITPGTDAKLVFRLVNNDDDTKTEVRLRKVKISPKETTDIPVSTGVPEEGTIADKIDFRRLTDVSESMTATYGQTSFNEDSKTLYTDLSVKNEGQYLIRGPLLVGVTNISDPTVRLKNPDGVGAG